MNARTVTSEITAALTDPPPEMRMTVVMSYSDADPYAVQAAFDVGLEEPVEWLFARDLLAAGFLGWTGSGDVRIRIDERGQVLSMELWAGHRAVFEFDVDDVLGFLRRTYQLVPEGSESDHVDRDALVGYLTASGRPSNDAGGEK